MEEERRTRESKLRDRLSKKRKAKEEEMQKAEISDRVQQVSRVVFNNVLVFSFRVTAITAITAIEVETANRNESMLYTHASVVNRKKK